MRSFWQKRLIVSWCLFDVGIGVLLSAFMVTFPLFFSHFLNVNPAYGAKNWELTYIISAILIAIICPLFGLLLERFANIKFWLVFLNGLLCFCLLLLHWVKPRPTFLLLTMFIVISISLLLNIMRIVYNVILSDIVPSHSLGRVSFFGYLCAMVGCVLGLSVVLMVPGLVRDFYIYSVVLPIAFILFTLPLLIFYCRSSYQGGKSDLSRRNIYALVRSLCTNGNVLYYLLARLLIFNGYTAYFIVFSIFVNNHFSPQSGQMVQLFFIGGLVAVVGGLFFSWLDDRIGAKSVLIVASLAGLLSVILEIVSVSFSMFSVFFLLSMLSVGPMISSMRSLLIRVAPEGRVAGLLGLCIFLGRSTSFVSPAIYYIAQGVWHLQRLSLLLSLVFVAAGIVCLFRIQES